MKKLKRLLVGSSGFVGSNLRHQLEFDGLASSANISSFSGEYFDEVIVAAGDARKWYANNHEKEDFKHINTLLHDVTKIKTDRLIHFSTVDVYANKRGSESDLAENICCDPYGKHRFYLEQCLIEHYQNVSTVRLPGLFGSGLKKNIIFDVLTHQSLEGFNPKSTFQWFDLKNLSKILEVINRHAIQEVNICSEPVAVEELLKCLGANTGYKNPCPPIISYAIESIHANKFGNEKYQYSKQETLSYILDFCRNYGNV